MDLKDILSISGHPGLYKFITQGRNGMIVESLETKKRMFAYDSYKVSSLEDISLYTEEKEVALADVLKKIYEKESGGVTINHKEPNEKLKDYFNEVLPDYDRSKVYTSDIKKILNWYNILHKLKMLDFKEEKKKAKEEKEETKKEEEKKEAPDKKNKSETKNKDTKAQE